MCLCHVALWALDPVVKRVESYKALIFAVIMESFCVSGDFQKPRSPGDDPSPPQCLLVVPADTGLALGPRGLRPQRHIRICAPQTV